jgi:hypothetical protein
MERWVNERKEEKHIYKKVHCIFMGPREEGMMMMVDI